MHFLPVGRAQPGSAPHPPARAAWAGGPGFPLWATGRRDFAGQAAHSARQVAHSVRQVAHSARQVAQSAPALAGEAAETPLQKAKFQDPGIPI